MSELDRPDETKPKFYSQKGIALATFFGAPLAASVLIRKNYISLDEPRKGNWTLLIGILSTIALFAGIFSVPENILNKIPNQVIPLFYTGVIYLIVNKLQGDKLSVYEEGGHKYISNWKATGIGALCALLIAAPIGGYIYMEMNNPVYDTYDERMTKFASSESKAFEFYDHMETNSIFQLTQELKNITIPSWERNLALINSLDTLEDITSGLLNRNEVLRAYCNLKLKSVSILKKPLVKIPIGITIRLIVSNSWSILSLKNWSKVK